MTFTFAKPIVTEQGEFPFAALTLVVSPAFREDGVEAQVVLRAQPYNILDGQIVRPTERVTSEQEDGSQIEIDVPTQAHDRSIVFGEAYSAARTNPALAKALGDVSAALQRFLQTEMIDGY